MKPIADRVIIKQQEKKEKVGSILLAEGSQMASPRGTVVAVGPKVQDVKEGDFVLFNVNYHQKILWMVRNT